MKGILVARSTVVFLLAVTLSGCLFGSIDTHDSHADGEFTVPPSVNLAADTPEVLKPYIPRFADMLEVRGLHLEKTADPKALQLRLTYNGGFDSVGVTAELLQGTTVVMHAEALTREPENFSDKNDLVEDLVDKVADKFQEQLGRLGSHVTVLPAPGK